MTLVGELALIRAPAEGKCPRCERAGLRFEMAGCRRPFATQTLQARDGRRSPVRLPDEDHLRDAASVRSRRMSIAHVREKGGDIALASRIRTAEFRVSQWTHETGAPLGIFADRWDEHRSRGIATSGTLGPQHVEGIATPGCHRHRATSAEGPMRPANHVAKRNRPPRSPQIRRARGFDVVDRDWI